MRALLRNSKTRGLLKAFIVDKGWFKSFKQFKSFKTSEVRRLSSEAFYGLNDLNVLNGLNSQFRSRSLEHLMHRLNIDD